VLAPADYYAPYALGWLEQDLDTALRTFSSERFGEPLLASFSFHAFAGGFCWPCPVDVVVDQIRQRRPVWCRESGFISMANAIHALTNSRKKIESRTTKSSSRAAADASPLTTVERRRTSDTRRGRHASTDPRGNGVGDVRGAADFSMSRISGSPGDARRRRSLLIRTALSLS